jgi:hypothetical protein
MNGPVVVAGAGSIGCFVGGHLQGAVVELARSLGQDAPVNRKVMEEVKRAEAAETGSPRVTPESLGL